MELCEHGHRIGAEICRLCQAAEYSDHRLIPLRMLGLKKAAKRSRKRALFIDPPKRKR